MTRLQLRRRAILAAAPALVAAPYVARAQTGKPEKACRSVLVVVHTRYVSERASLTWSHFVQATPLFPFKTIKLPHLGHGGLTGLSHDANLQFG